MAYDRESIIRKLKKLRAKAESAEAIGSEAEAQTFAEAVQRMLSEYKVEAAEVAENMEEEVDPIKSIRPNTEKHKIKFKRRENPWMKDLASIVAWAHYYRMSFVPGTNLVYMIGREADAETAGEVWCKLVRVAESIADKEYVDYFHECRRAGNVARARGFRASFLRGFVQRLRLRYSEHMEKIRDYYAHDKKALITLKSARSKVDEWVEKNVKKSDREEKDARIQNWAGFKLGQEKAQNLPLSSHKAVDA